MALKLSHPKEKFPFPDKQGSSLPNNNASGYIPSPELIAAVNVALALGQPLLLTGEPGTGKTGLAYYLAFKFELGDPVVFNAQTVSTKKDLFYHYDALGHFQWAQVHRDMSEPLSQADFEERLNLIRYEGLGLAIKKAQMEKKRSVVLIDEIDKAPRDLPNDLLAAIEKLRFDVPEIPGSEKVTYECPEDLKPVIIITSNSEKNLPDAFLRRVVYFHIDFPDKDELLRILQSRTTLFKDNNLEAIIDYFNEIRDSKGLSKKPATAELIAWATLLGQLKFPIEKLKPSEDAPMDEIEREILRIANSILAKTKEDLALLNDDLNVSES